nr:hypothetical protein [uncultured Caldimonas sp.]
MQQKPFSLRPLTYGALVINVLLLALLAWHLAFEAIPATVMDFQASFSFKGRALALVVLLPYALVLMYLARRIRNCIFEWKTAAAIVASVAGYIALVIAVTAYAVWNFMLA